jgi:hypothetical protein
VSTLRSGLDAVDADTPEHVAAQTRDAEPRYDAVLSQINFTVSCVVTGVTSTAALRVRDQTALPLLWAAQC